MFSIDNMNLQIELPENIDIVQLQKMAFIYNALTDGWTIKKQENQYIFSKKHEGKKEIYLDTYLQSFIEANLKGHIFN
jgi:hypothetical protein